MNEHAKDQDIGVLLSREKLLSRLLEQIWHVLMLVVLFGGLASIQRFRYTGWLPIYSLHLFLMFAYSACWLLRRKLSFNTKVGITLLVFYIVGISGLFAFGLIGAGIWWLILCTLIANVFYSLRAGIAHALVCLAIIVTAGAAIVGGYITIPFDANDYITQPSTWITLMVGCVALSMFIISAVVVYQRAILDLLQEVESSRKQKIVLLEKQQQQLDEIKALRSIIPICASCKKVRDDQGYWENVEAYMRKRADIQFTHGLCPDCGERLYGGIWNEARDDD